MRICLSTVIVLALTGCAWSDGPEFTGTNIIEKLVRDAAAPGSLVVSNDTGAAEYDAVIDMRVAVARPPSGPALIYVSGTHHVPDQPGYGAIEVFATLASDGTLGRVTRVTPVEDFYSYFPQMITLTDGVLLLRCDSMVTYWRGHGVRWRVSDPTRLTDVTGLDALCGPPYWRFGRSAQDGTVVGISTDYQMNLLVQRWKLDVTDHLAADGAQLNLGPIGSRERWVEEVAAGTYALLETSGDSLCLTWPGVAETRCATKPADLVVLSGREAGTNALLYFDPTSTAGSVYAWDVLRGGVEFVARGSVPAPAAGYSAWTWSELGAYAEKLEAQGDGLPAVPTAYQAITYDNGFSVTDVASTPCTSRAACRYIGESYLRGVVKVGAARIGVYYVWPWLMTNVTSMTVLAPLDRVD